MLGNKSISAIITIAFAISILLISFSFYILNQNLKLQTYRYIENRISYFNRKAIREFKDDLNNLGYTYIEPEKSFFEKAKILYTFERGRKKIEYIKYNNKFFIYITAPNGTILLKDNKHISYNKKLFYFIFGITIFILLILYFIIIKKLLPLKKLLLHVKELADEKFDTSFNIEGDDEISTLAKEFQKSAKKLKELKLSRDIFVRNIMHELKTPITKGKLLLSLPESETNRELMEKVFYRLQNLIEEFSGIERFLSLKKSLNLKNYFLDDLIDSALDLTLFDESNIIKEYENQKIKVDFKLFVIALKNLIDNGIKYSKDNKIIIKNKGEVLLFCNRAEPLKYPFSHYLEPSYDEKSDKLSLGIYITNHILKAHNFTFNYEYKDGKNIFILQPQHKL